MMECNKDEAIRARDLAEKKMQVKDFVGAKKFASKAQQLCPDLDGIIQMLTVCEVHCASEVKINGADDFYSILQVQPGAEELLIKKQYKKLALFLHPDKNKFPGAEAAFKLISEANRILTDQSKRSFYDIKRNTTVGVVKTKPPAQHANNAKFPNGQTMRNRFENVQFNGIHYEQQQTNTAPTFWTSCPFCRIRYQYYRTIMNRSLRCQNCMKPFVAYDLNSQNSASGASGYPHAKGSSGQHAYDNSRQFNQSNVAGRPATSQPSQHFGAKADHARKFSHIETDQAQGGADGKVDDIKYEKVKLEETNKKEEPCARASGSLNKKRNRSVMESSDLENQKDGFCIKKNAEGKSEKISEVQTSHVDADVCGAVPCVSYPDPEFHEFDLHRNAHLFKVGQIWALYDNLDGMPRYYARITSVVTTVFKVRFTWLEHNPDCQPGIDWSEKELPVGSGNFKLGSSQVSEERPMFSHQMVWDKGHQKNSYVIRPRKNEIWALLKNWDMKWAYEADVRKSFEYEIVEIFSGDVDSVVTVMPLVKVAGFTSVFARLRCETALLTIPPDERLRFSHMIPSHKLSGSEREGIPAGSYELDPGSLPVNFDEIYPSVSYKIDAKVGGQDAVKGRSSIELDADVKPTSCHLTSNKGEELPNVHAGRPLHPNCDQEDNTEAKLHDEIKVAEDITSSISKQDKRNGGSPSYPKDLLYDYPEPEFHDFGSVKSFDKIQSGQIWALYCDIDGFPKYYAVIKDVDVNAPNISLNWLEGRPLQDDEIKWAEKELPLSCGLFKVLRDKNDLEVYTSLEAFSHLVLAKPSKKKHRYEIYPRVGEVWALYRKWTVTWEESDMCNCEFDVVEILNTESSIQVQYLSKLKEYNSVFKPKQVNGVIAKAEIPRDRLLQFSHCIPSFRMTEERGGELRGYWELDPAAVPELLFCT